MRPGTASGPQSSRLPSVSYSEMSPCNESCLATSVLALATSAPNTNTHLSSLLIRILPTISQLSTSSASTLQNPPSHLRRGDRQSTRRVPTSDLLVVQAVQWTLHLLDLFPSSSSLFLDLKNTIYGSRKDSCLNVRRSLARTYLSRRLTRASLSTSVEV